MANLILHNVPDDLYDRLKETAAEHHRSITQEAIAMIKDALVPVSKTVTEDTARTRPKLTWEEYSLQMKDLWSMPVLDHRTPDEIIGYDENGLPT
ncbi:MAG: hypothetical protein DM484_30955 [Candidatus Methylumidiphilus alinenensis]|uniref:Antitoxin FitA-like ribbon-helix-helix domain-containing protein n=1 Tax=Candidatus Methylumidiphilus alinenensis TaxID=2202197 RepID=A0A2W4S486_9GAMM|nr:MAG: hypothetical protein DM484_30955 [Candidatus Methylumidiphilus alinenensis]